MAAKTEETTAVVEQPQVSGDLALWDDDILADAGKGNEKLGARDVVIPRLQIAQALSPQLKDSKPEFIEGLVEGGVFNTATSEILYLPPGRNREATAPLMIIPVYYHRRFIEWVPRAAGGGLVNPDHPESIMEEAVKGEKGKMMLPNGNEISETPENFIVFIRPDGSYEEAVLSMPGSKAKVSRAWNTVIRNFRVNHPVHGLVKPARWYNFYEFTTVPETNDQGDFFNWKVGKASPVLARFGKEVYNHCRQFNEMIEAGLVKADVENPAENEGKTTNAF